jgi:putative ABC transport system permease protein
MSVIASIRTIITITVKHLVAQRWMTVATLIGLTFSVGLIMVVPLYADAVSFRILDSKLDESSGDSTRPTFSYFFHYVGAWRGALELEDVEAADQYLMGPASDWLDLPMEHSAHHFQTGLYQIFPDGASSYEDERQSLGLLSFATTSQFADQIDILEGRFPQAGSFGGPIEVMISAAFADSVGWQIGETYTAFNHRLTNGQQTFPIVITGIWQASDPGDSSWFYQPSSFDNNLVISEDQFRTQIAPAVNDEIDLAAWYWIVDGERVGTDDVDVLIGATGRIERELEALLSGASTFSAPTDALFSYRRDVARLSQLLFAFNVPTVGLVLAFTGLVGSMSAGQRRNEFAILRSRGGTALQVTLIALLEIILLGISAYALGAVLGLGLTQVVSRTRSFMDFSAEAPLRIALTPAALSAGLWAILLAVLAQIIPVINTSRHTIVSYKLSQARSLQASWWQRVWLDVILLAVTVYGIYQLRGQGGINISTGGGDLFQNPLLLWLPAITIFAFTLLFLRLLPLLMRLLGGILQQTNSVALLQGARYLARTPGRYNTPLILLIMTVSFSVFTASIARTLDLHLYDQTYYAVGSDLNIQFADPAGSSPFSFGGSDTDAAPAPPPVPIAGIREIPGVKGATRLGEFPLSARIGQDQFSGQFLGIDSADFARAAYWRSDFSRARIGSLMNGLSSFEEGVLVPESLLRETGVQGGDTVRVVISFSGTDFEMATRVVGTFDYFPTWDPTEDPVIFVGNMDYLNEQVGFQLPFGVLMTTDRGLDQALVSQAKSQLRRLGAVVYEPFSSINAVQVRPERQGLFGLLSTGFIASAILTVLGLLMYAVFSYQRRLVELGVLRAVGLSTEGMTRLVAWELVLLIVSGILLGTTLGVMVSRFFIPFLQIGTTYPVPPVLVEIAWDAVSQVYFLFGVLFYVALASLVMLATRLRIFMAIKLGESV